MRLNLRDVLLLLLPPRGPRGHLRRQRFPVDGGLLPLILLHLLCKVHVAEGVHQAFHALLRLHLQLLLLLQRLCDYTGANELLLFLLHGHRHLQLLQGLLHLGLSQLLHHGVFLS